MAPDFATGRAARVGLWTLHASALFVLAFTIVRYIDRPLRFDETDFARQARGVLLHGVPLLTLDEDRAIDWPTPPLSGVHYGMWHPPLYFYTLAGALYAGGNHNWAFRSVGAVSLLLTLAIGWQIAGVVMPGAPSLVRAAPLSLALLSPLVTDASLLLDIDNTVLAPLLFLLLWRFLRAEHVVSPRAILELAVLFAVALSAKLTTPVLALGSCGVYALLGQDRIRRTGAVIAAGLLGAALFALAYWAYCRLLSYPAAYMFDASYLGKHDMYTSVKTLKSVLFAVRWNIAWLGPLMTLLAVLVGSLRVAEYVWTRKQEPVDLLMIFALAVFTAYAIVGAMWGKYTMPGAFAAAMAAGAVLAPAWASTRIPRPWTLAAVVAMVAIAHELLPVPQIRTAGYDLRNADLSSAVWNVRNLSMAISCLIGGGVAWLTARRWICFPSRWVSIALGLAICVVASAPVTTARVVGPSYDRGPLRATMDRGFEMTVAYMNQAAPEGAIILAPKDIGYYYRGRYYGLEALLGSHGQGAAVDVGRHPDVTFVVDSALYPIIANPQALGAIGFDRIEHIGDFRIYVKR